MHEQFFCYRVSDLCNAFMANVFGCIAFITSDKSKTILQVLVLLILP